MRLVVKLDMSMSRKSEDQLRELADSANGLEPVTVMPISLQMDEKSWHAVVLIKMDKGKAFLYNSNGNRTPETKVRMQRLACLLEEKLGGRE